MDLLEMTEDTFAALRRQGVVRFKWPNGAEVEFSSACVHDDWSAAGAQPKQEQADTTAPIEQMPSRAELRAQMEQMGAPPEGAPVVAP